MTPRISVVLPVYNATASIAAAIASIRAQTVDAWEMIVVDDGSTDGTASAIGTAAADDRRIKVISEPHRGIVAALNAGMAAAQGAYLARMDADDESSTGRLAAQAALLDEAPDVGVVGCLVEFGGDRKACSGYALHVDWMNTLVTPAAISANRFIESPFAHPSVMFRREIVDRWGGYRDGDFPEDYELWLRWLDAGVKMAKVPEVLFRWNDHSGRLSRVDRRYDADAFFRTKARWLAREIERVAAGRSIWVWGAGRPTRKRAAYLAEHGVEVAGYIDVDPRKQGRPVGGRPVLSPTEIPSPDSSFVLGYVRSRGARELIRTALSARGYREPADFLACA